MTCPAFRAAHARFGRMPLPREVWDTPEYATWSEHLAVCHDCQRWNLVEELSARGVDPGAYPCLHVAQQVTHRCEMHPDPQDCPDALVRYSPVRREYGLPIRDGGSAMSVIRYCPWCGTALRPPRRAAPGSARRVEP